MKTAQQIQEKIANGEIEWFGRDKFIKEFSEYLLEIKESKHVCLKGIWGSGKTTTIFGVIEKLKEEVLVLYLDAWKYENYEHPTYALLKAIQESDSKVYNRIKTKVAEKNISYQVGVNLPFIGSFEIGSEYSIENHKIISEAEYIEEFNQILIDVIQEYKKENANKLIIFVDELDRAKPEFALRLLETFHHLHDKLPTHFVYSADINQLNSMIKHYYGYEYNTEIFLHKVFDDIIPLAPLSKDDMANYFDKHIDTKKYNDYLVIELIQKHLPQGQIDSLRTINYVIKLVEENLNAGYFKAFNNGFGALDYYLGNKTEVLWGYVELMIILVTKSLNESFLVQEFLAGRQCEELADYILEANSTRLNALIYESYLVNVKDENKVTFDDFINENNMGNIINGLKGIFKESNNRLVFKNIIL